MSSVTMPRPRYVAFQLDGAEPMARRDVAAALSAAAKAEWKGTAPQLTRYGWPHGIVRCEHDQLKPLLALLDRMAGGWNGTTLRTLSTAGTILALTSRLGILAGRAEPPPPRAGPAAASPASRPSGARRAR